MSKSIKRLLVVLGGHASVAVEHLNVKGICAIVDLATGLQGDVVCNLVTPLGQIQKGRKTTFEDGGFSANIRQPVQDRSKDDDSTAQRCAVTLDSTEWPCRVVAGAAKRVLQYDAIGSMTQQ